MLSMNTDHLYIPIYLEPVGLVPPRFSFSNEKSRSVEAATGSGHAFFCQAAAFPAPVSQWVPLRSWTDFLIEALFLLFVIFASCATSKWENVISALRECDRYGAVVVLGESLIRTNS